MVVTAFITNFQLGDNITAEVWVAGWASCTIKIKGSGYMWNVEDFEYLGVEAGDNFTIHGDGNGVILGVDYRQWGVCVSKHRGDLEIPNGVYNVCDNFFKMNMGGTIDTLTLGNSLLSIGECAFELVYGGGISKLVCNSHILDTIGNYAFKGNVNLTEANFNYGIPVTIGKGAFQNCKSVDYLRLGELKYVSAMAFNNCNSLIAFNKHNIIHEFEVSTEASANGIFQNCNNLKTFTFLETAKFDTDIQDGFNKYFWLELNAGSNLDEEGYQKTVIYYESEDAVAHRWKTLDNRVPIFKKFVRLVYYKHNGRWYGINAYDETEGSIPLYHNGMLFWLKAIDITETGVDSSESHLCFTDDDKWYQIGK